MTRPRLPLAALLLVPTLFACGEDPGGTSPIGTASEPVLQAKPPVDRGPRPEPALTPIINEEEAPETGEPLDARAPTQPAPETAGAPQLLARYELRLTGKPFGVTALDLDGDGTAELIATTRSPGTLHVWRDLKPGLVRADAPTILPIGDYPIGPVVFGELLAAASRATNELVLCTSDDLAAGRVTRTVTLPSPPRVLCAGDVDGDGEEELLALTKLNEIHIVEADGSFETTHTSHDQPCCAHALADGRVVIGFQTKREVALYRRDPEQGVAGWSVDWLRTFDGVPRAIGEVDLDSDGDLELSIAGGNDVHWVFGLGSEDAWTDAEPKQTRYGSIPIDLDAADLEGDGQDELFSLAFFESNWVAFGGAAMTRKIGGYAGQTPVAIETADFDGDGRCDIAIANSEARRISLMFGNAQGRVDLAVPIKTGGAPTPLAHADFDGDGIDDVVALNSLDNSYTVISKLASSPARSSGMEARKIACGDVDGDGKADLCILRRGPAGGLLSIHFGNGDLTFAQRPDVPDAPLGKSADDVLVHDFDGDGVCEIVTADHDGDTVTMLRKRNAEPLAFNADTVGVSSGPIALAVCDTNADGTDEILACVDGTGDRVGISILGVRLSDDTPMLLEESFLATDATPIDLAVGDIDGDGDEDAVLLAHDRGRDSLGLVVPYLNDGGTWQPAESRRAGLRVYAIETADVDRNGQVDVFVSAQNSHHVNWWMSYPGEPLTMLRQPDVGVGTGPLGLAATDIDGDGWIDLCVANAFSNSVSIALNRGAK